MEDRTRHDIFERGDRTSLVCVDEPELYHTTIGQLTALGCKIHTGLFVEDIALKLKTNAYDLVVVSEHFNEADLESNRVLAELVSVPASQRRNFFVVLLGPGMVTGDDVQAFRESVDLVIGLPDLANLGFVMQRAIARRDEFYRAFKECETIAGMG